MRLNREGRTGVGQKHDYSDAAREALARGRAAVRQEQDDHEDEPIGDDNWAVIPPTDEQREDALSRGMGVDVVDGAASGDTAVASSGPRRVYGRCDTAVARSGPRLQVGCDTAVVGGGPRLQAGTRDTAVVGSGPRLTSGHRLTPAPEFPDPDPPGPERRRPLFSKAVPEEQHGLRASRMSAPEGVPTGAVTCGPSPVAECQCHGCVNMKEFGPQCGTEFVRHCERITRSVTPDGVVPGRVWARTLMSRPLPRKHVRSL